MRSAHHNVLPLPRALGRLLLLACFSILSCDFPARILQQIHPPSPTPTRVVSATPSPTSTPTFTLTVTKTATLSPTPTRQATITPSPTSESTLFSPSQTPSPDQIVAGNAVWDLKSVDYPAYITVIGRLFSPPTRRDPFPAYVFMRMNFNCTTGDSLIKLYAGQDMGLTFIQKQAGYPDLSIEDQQGHKYLVTLLGTCWLAAPLPATQTRDGYFVLNFKDMPTFRFSVKQSEQNIDQRICYISESSKISEVFTANPDGSDPLQLTEDLDSASAPSWSPDHDRLAYVSQRSGNADILLIDPAGHPLANVSPSLADEGGPAWSPDGKSLAFHSLKDGNWEIYSLVLDGSLIRNLTHHPEADMYPFWSPDVNQIVFQSHRDGNWEIYLMDKNGMSLKRLTQHPAEDILPSWSPDGKNILFWTKRDGIWRLYLMDPEGKQLRPLTYYENPGASPSRAAWSRDGKSILLSLLRDGFMQLFAMRLDGSAPERITKTTTNDSQPCW
jgi:hypothetical protein